MSEAAIMRQIMVAVSKIGARLFRNNNGFLKDARGKYVHFGLGTGTSDLVGWVPVFITDSMVGTELPVFLAIEVKTPSGKLTDEQKNFLYAVNTAGGVAFVARSPEEAVGQLKQ